MLKQTIIELERELLQSEVRSSVVALDRLISDDFWEFGASGASFGKADVVNRLPSEAALKLQFQQDQFRLRIMNIDWVQLTYRAIITAANQVPKYSLRSSLWHKTSLGWQMSFHQGTPCSPFILNDV